MGTCSGLESHLVNGGPRVWGGLEMLPNSISRLHCKECVAAMGAQTFGPELKRGVRIHWQQPS